MERLKNYINRLSTCKFIFISSLLAYISTIPFSIIRSYFADNSGVNINMQLPLITNLIILIILGPILESILIIIIIKIVSKVLKKSIHITAVISALIFSSLHMYSFFYILGVLIPAYTLVFSYLLYENKSKYLNSLGIMICIHMLLNLYGCFFIFII